MHFTSALDGGEWLDIIPSSYSRGAILNSLSAD